MSLFKKIQPGLLAAAVQYQLLQPIAPYIQSGSTPDLATYLNQMFKLGIAVAVGLAIIKITFGGIKYITTENINEKGEGKQDIQMALYGLLLALGAWVILYTINPCLLSTNIGGNTSGSSCTQQR